LRIVWNTVTNFYFCIQQTNLLHIPLFSKITKPLPLNNNVPKLSVIIYNTIWLKLMHIKMQPFRRFSKFPFVFIPITCSRKYTYHLLFIWTSHCAHRVYFIVLDNSNNKTPFPISGLNNSRATGSCNDTILWCHLIFVNLLHVTLLAHRILRRLLDFSAPLTYFLKNRWPEVLLRGARVFIGGQTLHFRTTFLHKG
jgi:hypothetical protein